MLAAFDLDYALEVARRVAAFGTYERGFRPAGSVAAQRCAEYLAAELRALGLPNVDVAEYQVDGWEFAGARVEPEGGPALEAVAYGGATGTSPEGLEGALVDCRAGTAADYRRVDVRGKIALIEIDFEAMNWPGVVLLEAAHQGAAAVVCWPAHAYGELPDAFHTHDLQAASLLPMLNVSRADGRRLRQYQRARLVSTARPLTGVTGRNLVATIPGTEHPDQWVIIGDHYDAWFHGFMDDAVGVGAVLALARAMIASGYQPRRSLAFVLHDAEEYGKADSPWDWCVGAYQQVTRLRPDWAGHAVGAVIFEMCGFRDTPSLDWYVSPDLAPLAGDVLAQVRTEGLFPLGPRLYPQVTTWVDAFSYTAAGIPSASNLELTDEVRANYYHSQYDTEALLDPDKYAAHVAGLSLLALTLDQAATPPADPAAHARSLLATLPEDAPAELVLSLHHLEAAATRLMAQPMSTGDVNRLLGAVAVLNRGLTWLGGESMETTMYPHEQPLHDLRALLAGRPVEVTGMDWGQNVSYPVYRQFLFGHHENADRCGLWAAGRIWPYIDAWELVTRGLPVPPALIREAEHTLQEAYAHETEVIRQALALLLKEPS